MKYFNNYKNLLLEFNILVERLNIINEYEEKLLKEKKEIDDLIKHQSKTIKQIEQNIDQLSGIENKLFKEIVINGINVSKAIEKVAEEEQKDVSTLWKNYYPKVKYKIDQLYVK